MSAPANALTRILAYKRDEVAALKARVSAADLTAKARDQAPPRGFLTALRIEKAAGRLGLIAEIKRASPSAGLIREDFDPAWLAASYASGGATCLSVLTDEPSFQGDPAYVGAAQSACSLPVLRKDFMIDPIQVAEARAMGADAILVILAAVDDTLAKDLMAKAADWGMDALVEVHDAGEMRRARGLGASMVGVNNRDLTRMVTDLATTEALSALAPPGALLVTESGVRTPADVARLSAAGADAFLIGESLMRQPDPGVAARSLFAHP